MNNNGFPARLGLAIGIMAANSLIVIRLMVDVNMVVTAILTVLSISGFVVFVADPKNGRAK